MTNPSSPEPVHYGLPIRRPVTTAMIFLTMVVFGLKSYLGLPINLMPDISYPTLTVRTEYEGGAPGDIEKLVTRPLEETLSLANGLVEVSSTSSAGISEIILEFTWDTDMNVAHSDVRDRIDFFVPPQEVTEKPIILRYDPSLDPVMRVAITGPDLTETVTYGPERDRRYAASLRDIREAAERYVKSDLEGEKGIAQVNIVGGIEKEIQILVDAERLKSLGLSLQSVKEIHKTGIALPGGGRVNLGDVATVQIGAKDLETMVRIDGREAVELEIFKDGDANTVNVSRKIRQLLGMEKPFGGFKELMDKMYASRGEEGKRTAEVAKTLRSRLPDDVELTIISDQSRFITGSIREVQRTAFVGGALALLILYFFLRDMRSTTIVGVAIPISVVATFIPMFMQEISLNIMSLGGLALGIGMLVDNSIVVLESIFRCREEGDSHVDAAARGTKEVGSAVTASTLTTIAVFLPIAFIEGVAGQLFRDQAMTVTFSLMASLLVALYLIPMIASRGKLALLSGDGAVWIIRAYRKGRDDRGYGIAKSFLFIVPISLGLAAAYVIDLTSTTYQPITRLWRKPYDGPIKNGMALLAARIFSPIIAVLLTIVLVFMFCTKALAFLLVTSLFFVVGFYVLIGVIAVVTFKIILWLPLRIFDFTFSLMQKVYVVILRTSLQFGPVLLLVVVIGAVHAGQVASGLGRELIPAMKQGEFGLRMETPPGTQLMETAEQTKELEQIILALPDVSTVAVQIGKESSGASGQRGENVAEFTVLLKDPNRTSQYQDKIIESLRQEIAAVTPNEFTFTLPRLFSFKTAVELQIRGDDLGELKRIGEEAIVAIADVDGLEDAELSMKRGYPEIIIELDRELLAAQGLTPDRVAQRLRREVQGDVASKFNEAGFRVDIRVRANQAQLASLQELRMLSVVDGGTPLPLYRVAKRVDVEEGPSEIRRIDQRQVAIITANVSGRDLGAVTDDLLARVNQISRPPDYDVVAGGQNRELQTSYRSLTFALLLAIFLVYVVMACQFESIRHPALVMFSVPLAFIGVIYALAWLQIDLSIVVFIGGITLAGIVVNNAIVLVDYVNQLRARNYSKRDAVIAAGQVRLRPILMTTLTTVLGLIPMATYAGEGAEIRQPMAVTIIAGLLTATFLTLVLIPVVYDLFGGRDSE
jgi:HAE1 family hydrophobic/amphiphilic exporter-1